MISTVELGLLALLIDIICCCLGRRRRQIAMLPMNGVVAIGAQIPSNNNV